MSVSFLDPINFTVSSRVFAKRKSCTPTPTRSKKLTGETRLHLDRNGKILASCWKHCGNKLLNNVGNQFLLDMMPVCLDLIHVYHNGGWRQSDLWFFSKSIPNEHIFYMTLTVLGVKLTIVQTSSEIFLSEVLSLKKKKFFNVIPTVSKFCIRMTMKFMFANQNVWMHVSTFSLTTQCNERKLSKVCRFILLFI